MNCLSFLLTTGVVLVSVGFASIENVVEEISAKTESQEWDCKPAWAIEFAGVRGDSESKKNCFQYDLTFTPSECELLWISEGADLGLSLAFELPLALDGCVDESIFDTIPASLTSSRSLVATPHKEKSTMDLVFDRISVSQWLLENSLNVDDMNSLKRTERIEVCVPANIWHTTDGLCVLEQKHIGLDNAPNTLDESTFLAIEVPDFCSAHKDVAADQLPFFQSVNGQQVDDDAAVDNSGDNNVNDDDGEGTVRFRDSVTDSSTDSRNSDSEIIFEKVVLELDDKVVGEISAVVDAIAAELEVEAIEEVVKDIIDELFGDDKDDYDNTNADYIDLPPAENTFEQNDAGSEEQVVVVETDTVLVEDELVVDGNGNVVEEVVVVEDTEVNNVVFLSLNSPKKSKSDNFEDRFETDSILELSELNTDNSEHVDGAFDRRPLEPVASMHLSEKSSPSFFFGQMELMKEEEDAERRSLLEDTRCYEPHTFDIDSCLLGCETVEETEWRVSLVAAEYMPDKHVTAFFYEAHTNQQPGICTHEPLSKRMTAFYLLFNGCCEMDVEQSTAGIHSDFDWDFLRGGWLLQSDIPPNVSRMFALYVNGNVPVTAGSVCVRGNNVRCACDVIEIPDLCNADTTSGISHGMLDSFSGSESHSGSSSDSS